MLFDSEVAHEKKQVMQHYFEQRMPMRYLGEDKEQEYRKSIFDKVDPAPSKDYRPDKLEQILADMNYSGNTTEGYRESSLSYMPSSSTGYGAGTAKYR